MKTTSKKKNEGDLKKTKQKWRQPQKKYNEDDLKKWRWPKKKNEDDLKKKIKKMAVT